MHSKRRSTMAEDAQMCETKALFNSDKTKLNNVHVNYSYTCIHFRLSTVTFALSTHRL